MVDADDRPRWAQRLSTELKARGWTQRDAVRAMRAHSASAPSEESLLRSWKRWESGQTLPDSSNQKLIAATFGTVAPVIWPVTGRKRGQAGVTEVTGLSTLEVITRLQARAADAPTLTAARIVTDQLCTDYASVPAPQLLDEGRVWLSRINGLRDGRITLGQHREILETLGWLTLLVGCVEHDSGNRAAAEASRQAALSLGEEAGQPDIQGWAHEMTAWFELTAGNYPGVVAAAEEGIAVAPNSGVAVQLAAQQAKAWARLGDRRAMEVALDRGRRILERLPVPENTEHHFQVDHQKFDFYAMDTYRRSEENALALAYAGEVIDASTDVDGTVTAPMRVAEALITQGVVAARDGDLEQAVTRGQEALNGERKSLPSLRMVASDLTQILKTRYKGEPEAAGYLEQVRAIKVHR